MCKRDFNDLSGDDSKTVTFKFQLPECDYVEVQPFFIQVPYTSSIASGDAELKTGNVEIAPSKLILIPGGNAVDIGVKNEYRNGDTKYYMAQVSTTLTASYALTGKINYSDIDEYYISWYYVCYKYSI